VPFAVFGVHQYKRTMKGDVEGRTHDEWIYPQQRCPIFHFFSSGALLTHYYYYSRYNAGRSQMGNEDSRLYRPIILFTWAR